MIQLVLAAFLTLWAGPVLAQYVSPIGIPDVPAGLEPDRATPSSASQCPNWPSAASTNCYYVDNTHGSATDTANANGYPNLPRLTLPGSVTFTRIEMVGGGSAYAFTNRVWTATGGSESSPAVITGIRKDCKDPTDAETFPSTEEPNWTDCPVIGAGAADLELSITATWIIVEGFNLNRVKLYSGRRVLDNALYRWIHLYGSRDGNSSAFSLAWAVAAADYNNNIVVYQTEISDWCDMASVSEEDCLGAAATRGSSNWWILNNLWYDINGDSMRTGTNPAPRGHTLNSGLSCPSHDTNRAFNIYIGGNTFKVNGENGVDFKDAYRVIFSQNQVLGPFNLGGSATGGGGGISGHNHATETWVIFNTITGGPIGAATTVDLVHTEDTYYIGNVFHSIEHTDPTYDPSSGSENDGAAFHIRNGEGDCVFQHNTLYHVDRGTNIESTQSACTLIDNIYSTLNEDSSHINFEDTDTTLTNSTISHNLVQRVLGVFGQLGSRRYTTLAAFNRGSAEDCVSCVEGDPAFTNAASADFSIGMSSAAKDVGSGVETWYDLFFTTFGVSIKKDAAGTVRPQNGLWDIGAYEYTAGGGGGSTPVRLRLR